MDPADQGVEPSRVLELANGHTVGFTIQQLPARAPAILCSIAVLNAAWGPWHLFDGYLLSQIPFSLFGIHVPLCYWAEMWKGHPDYSKLKKRLDDIKLLVGEYRRFPDPQDFHNTYPSSAHALEAASGRRCNRAIQLATRVQGGVLGVVPSFVVLKRYLRAAQMGQLQNADMQLVDEIEEFLIEEHF